MTRCFCLVLVLSLWFVVKGISADPAFDVLQNRCGSCHVGEESLSDFRLDDIVATERDVKSQLRDSILDRILSDDDDYRMPPTGRKLNRSETDSILSWIDGGAKWHVGDSKTRAWVDHWSFQSLHSEKDRAIDSVVASYAKSHSMQLSDPANPTELVRRLSFDLRGLPPSVSEIRSFLNDNRPDSYQRLVDRWLASPEFGEHWASHWLDVARYADSDGSYKDDRRPDAFRYRDWVIRSIQRDMPIDEFSIAQLAGDILPDDRWDDRIAASFHRNAIVNRDACADPVEERFNRLVDRVNTTSQIWLGLTIQCAQCHDHKLEPVSTKQYYQFMAFFENANEITSYKDHVRAEQLQKKVAYLTESIETRRKEIEREVGEARHSSTGMESESKSRWLAKVLRMVSLSPAILLGSVGFIAFVVLRRHRLYRIGWCVLVFAGAASFMLKLESLSAVTSAELNRSLKDEVKLAIGSDDDRRALMSMRMRVREELEAIPKVQTFSREPKQSFIHRRGQFASLGAPVFARLPDWFGPNDSGSDHLTRLDLARWVFSDENVLTPRVFANRIASRLFGHSIAGSLDNLGPSGDVNAEWIELIDGLAADLVESGWSRKHLIRRVVLSDAYQASIAQGPYVFSLQRRRALSAEEVRDFCLCVSGQLQSYVPNDEHALAATPYMRSVFQVRTRQNLPALSTAFGAPSREQCCVQRQTPSPVVQALAMMNDPLVCQAARKLGEHCSKGTGTIPAKLKKLFLLCLSREPDETELRHVLSWAEEFPNADTAEMFAGVAQALLGHNEALHR